jgi:hypothetical protein
MDAGEKAAERYAKGIAGFERAHCNCCTAKLCPAKPIGPARSTTERHPAGVERPHAIVLCKLLLAVSARCWFSACRIDDDTMTALLNSSPALRALEVAGGSCSLGIGCNNMCVERWSM